MKGNPILSPEQLETISSRTPEQRPRRDELLNALERIFEISNLEVPLPGDVDSRYKALDRIRSISIRTLAQGGHS